MSSGNGEKDTSKGKPLPLPHSKKLKILTTCAVLFGNMTFGCAFNFYSPALEDLRRKYDSTVDEISIVFTIVLVCYCIGALTSGFINDWINRQIGAIICLSGIAFAMYMTPHCPSQTVFFVVGGILGFFLGQYDTTQVVWVIEIWQSKAGPYIQAQHFFYALGSNIPPLLLAPFLSDKDDEDSESITNSTWTTTQVTSTLTEEIEESKIYIPFTIAGGLTTLAVGFQVFLFIFHRYYTPPVEEDLENDDSDNNDTTEKALSANNLNNNEYRDTVDSKSQLDKSGVNPSWFSVKWNLLQTKWPRLRLIILASLFLGAYQGMEMCTMQFVPTFGQYSDLKLSEPDAALVLTGLTAAFAVGRAIGILVVLKVPPALMLCGNLTLIVAANLILLIWANTNHTMFWAGCITLGAGFSTMFASYCAFIERYLYFTNSVGSFFIVTGSSIAAIYPLIVGNIIEEKAVVLTYTNFFSISVCTTVLIIAYKLTYNSKKRV